MSMSDCEKELARLIHVIVEYGNYVEDARIELANSTNFSPFASFRRINASSTGFLTEDDLDNFLRQNGLVLNEGALTQFFTMEKDKSYKITYNNFLNQMLPTTNIDLRNSCLERPHHRNNEVSSADVDQLITAVYQKENEYTRVVEGVKNRLLMFSNSLLDRIFQSLADDVTGYLSFKSISTFMKQNNYSFNKKDYESFMSRVDKNLTGKVSPTDFKYLMFPHGTISNTNRQNELTHHKAGSIFSGISPIKNWNSSPNKNTARKPFEASMIGENDRSLLALKAKSNAHSPDNKFPTTSELGQKVNPSSLKGEQKFSVSNKPHDGAPNSRAILYNQEIAAINDQIILQNAPETNYKDKNSKNPLEWRYLDPVYHNYWSYHRDHNRTLSPNYFNRAESRTFPHNQRSHNPSRPGTNFVPFFNPTFVDPGTYENLERYPENPFRYTDHGHFFKNYYASLRHNYYDQYYNYIPYKTKVPSSKSERNSPEKSRHLSRSHSPQSNLNHIDYNYNEQQVRSNDNLVADGLIPFSKKQPAQNYPSQGQPEKPPRRTHDILSEHEILRQPRPQQVDTVPYQYVFVSDHNSQARQEENELKSAIKIEKQPFLASPKLNQDPLKNFAKDKREPHITEDLNSNKPYTFVVVNSKNNI